MVKRWVAAAGILAALLVGTVASATVTSTDSRVTVTAAGGTNVAFSFPVSSASQVEVLVNGVKQSSGYTVTLNDGGANGGTVVFGVAPTVGAVLVAQRTLPLTQELSLPLHSPFKAKVIESAFDARVWQLQQLDRYISDEAAAWRAGDATISSTHAADKSAQATRDAGQDQGLATEQSARAAADAAVVSSTLSAVSTLNGRSLTASDMSSVLAFGSTTPRTLTARFAEVANVKDFGALGDGVTDDRAAVAAAVASGVGVVWFPAGIYHISSSVQITSPVTLLGVGETSILDGPGDATTNYFFDAQASVTARGLVFSDARFAFRVSDLPVGSNLTVSGCVFTDLMRGIYGRPASATALGTLSVTDSEFTDLESAVYTRYLSWDTVFVSNVKVHDLALKPVPNRAALEVGLRGYALTGIDIGYLAWDDVVNVSVVGSSFFNIHHPMVDPWDSAPIVAADQEVHGVGVQGERVSISANTFYAISGAEPNDDVEGIMARGVAISVVGNTLVDAGQIEAAINVKAADAILVSGNVIDWTTGYASSGKTGILVTGDEAVVTGNIIRNAVRGITTRSLDSVISNNLIGGENGIGFGAESPARILVVRGNKMNVTSNGLQGTNDNPVTTLIVEDNVLEGAFSNGVTGIEATYQTFRKNTFAPTPKATTQYGLSINANGVPISSLEVHDNTFRDFKREDGTDGRAVYFLGGATTTALATFTENTFENCYRGLFHSSGTTSLLQLERNVFSTVTQPLYVTGATITTSSVRGNIGFVSEARGTATVPAAATYVEVTHGLSGVLVGGNKRVQVTPQAGLGTATKWWVSFPSGTTFRINVDAAPGADVAFAYEATASQN